MSSALAAPSTFDEDEYADEEPREPCSNCEGEAAHVRTDRVNGWINEASAYDRYLYECLACGRRGSRTERGDRIGCVAPPAE